MNGFLIGELVKRLLYARTSQQASVLQCFSFRWLISISSDCNDAYVFDVKRKRFQQQQRTISVLLLLCYIVLINLITPQRTLFNDLSSVFASILNKSSDLSTVSLFSCVKRQFISKTVNFDLTCKEKLIMIKAKLLNLTFVFLKNAFDINTNLLFQYCFDGG